MAAAAAPGTTQDLTVTASVTSVCKFTGTVQTLNFGALDPSNAVAVNDKKADVTFKCTKGVSATVTQNNGSTPSGMQKRLKTTFNGTDYFIPYSIALSGDSVTGAGFGTNLTVTATGTIAADAYVDAPAGDYSDTVVLSVSP